MLDVSENNIQIRSKQQQKNQAAKISILVHLLINKFYIILTCDKA